jgi:hypothetical protein
MELSKEKHAAKLYQRLPRELLCYSCSSEVQLISAVCFFVLLLQV